MFLKNSFLLFCLLFVNNILFADKPELLLLNKYTQDMNVSGWYMSEKLDGVRAYWNGNELISRSGKVLPAPDFFLKDFPTSELDGELWSKRDDFSNISSIVNKKGPHNGWTALTFNVFEVPHADGNLTQRLSRVKESQYIHLLKQIKIKNRDALYKFLKDVETQGGEGVVIRNGSSSYYYGRTNDALKLKNYIDEECEVSGFTAGKGKNEGKIGALLCLMNNGKMIKIGSGLSNAERTDPPKIGSIITFKYYGLTSKGNPRFPIFMRKRLN